MYAKRTKKNRLETHNGQKKRPTKKKQVRNTQRTKKQTKKTARNTGISRQQARKKKINEHRLGRPRAIVRHLRAWGWPRVLNNNQYPGY